MPLIVLYTARGQRSLAFLVWQRRLTLSFMPYCYVDMSIVASVCARALALSSPDALFFTETRQCTLGILELDYEATFVWFLLFFVFQCESNRLIKPVRKALLIIPAEFCVCVYIGKVRIGQSASHYGAFLFFLPSSSKCLRVTWKKQSDILI